MQPRHSYLFKRPCDRVLTSMRNDVASTIPKFLKVKLYRQEHCGHALRDEGCLLPLKMLFVDFPLSLVSVAERDVDLSL